jgi:hypothetical protein
VEIESTRQEKQLRTQARTDEHNMLRAAGTAGRVPRDGVGAVGDFGRSRLAGLAGRTSLLAATMCKGFDHVGLTSFDLHR